MKFKGKKHIGSVLGGLVTMMGSIYVIYYMVILSQQVLLRQNPKMNLFYSRNDYEIDEKFYLKDSDLKL